MNTKHFFLWFLRFTALLILFFILFIAGSGLVSGMLPNVKSEPGLLPGSSGLLVVGIINTVLIAVLIFSSRWSGWKLALALSLSYYGTVTFLMQIETWYFLSGINVSPQLLSRLFLMGLPVAFIYIPFAIVILPKVPPQEHTENPAMIMPVSQWLWKLSLITISYLVLYWGAGYFIAWQNPELRAFYGSPGEILPFWTHTSYTIQNDPGLLPFQLLRALLWTLCALPVIRGSRLSAWGTAVVLGLLFSLPQNVVHILENPLIPNASVRLSHLIETASSTFIFAMIIAWLLHRKHSSVKDLFRMKSTV